jgi:hypothetical protein
MSYQVEIALEEAAVTRAWVSAWVIHNDHPELAAWAAENLPVRDAVHAGYMTAILEAVPAAFARRRTIEGR